MKNFNQKIDKFLHWLEDGENGDFRFLTPNRDCFELYRMENSDVEELTEDEGKYLDVYWKVSILNLVVKKRLDPSTAKLILGNEYGYVDRPKIKDEGPIDYVTFDTSGLGDEALDELINHSGESLENEAIKNKGEENVKDIQKQQ